jgi:hypothetical protein
MTDPSIAPGGTMTEQTPPTIDGPTALRLLREVVAEKPDYVYERGDNDVCQYVRDGKPSCVVGHVLTRAGRPVDLLLQNNTMMVGYLGSTFGLDEPARVILMSAQDSQDQGQPWSRALLHAEATATQLGVSA